MKYKEWLYYIPLVHQFLCDVQTLKLSITVAILETLLMKTKCNH
jgi:hypothetical protein